MIRIEYREYSGLLPAEWEQHAEDETKRLEAWYREDSQERPPFESRLWKELMPALRELFNDKCAYCETRLDVGSSGGVGHYRPRSIYWWLAYDRRNLLLVCWACNSQFKRDRFPINGDRAMGPEEDLSLEKPLLLNPLYDEPRDHLRFRGSKAHGLTPRGEATIDVMGLNRPTLVRERRRILERTKLRQLFLLGSSPESEVREALVEQFEELAGDAAPYAAAVRQNLDHLTDELRAELESAMAAKAAQQPGREKEAEPFEAEARPKPPRATIGVEDFGLDPAYIKRIEVTDFKSLASEEVKLSGLALPDPSGAAAEAEPERLPRSDWLVLIGENAAGKTTLLEAIALALAPRSVLDALDPTDFVRIPGEGEKEVARARVKLELDLPGYESIELLVSKERGFERSIEPPHRVLVRAYGPTRLLPKPMQRIVEQADRINRVENLFDPRVELCDVEAWLVELDSFGEGRFRTAATKLRELLPGDQVGELEIHDDRVWVRSPRGLQRLHALSGGYRSAIALAADLMSAIPPQQLNDLDQIPGIVLLDEIGTQLHPRWRMRIVNDLREAFPRVQFVVSTHEPLCLRGVSKAEILRVHGDAPKLQPLAEGDPDPKFMRVDQILTSRIFGLNSTIDPKVEKEFWRYYALLALQERTAEQQTECDTLARKLTKHNTLGYTRRDQLIYEIIDQFLAESDFASDQQQSEKIAEIPEDVRKRVIDLWSYAHLRPRRSR